jgi:hypothetical protein
MVAVTTEPTPWSSARHGRGRRLDHDRVSVAAPTGPAVPVGAAQRLLLVAAAVVVVVAVAVGAAAFGRVLDTHRGIPASPAAAASTTS